MSPALFTRRILYCWVTWGAPCLAYRPWVSEIFPNTGVSAASSAHSHLSRTVMLFFFFHSFLLKDNCFTEFCCFLSNLNMKKKRKKKKPQHESAIGVYITPPFWTSLPSLTPSHPSRLIQSPCSSFLRHTANSHWLSILHMVMQVSMLLFPYSSPSPLLSPCP